MSEMLHRGDVRGFLHEPEGEIVAGLALTHGAGGSSESDLVVSLARGFADAGLLVLRYDMPYRQRKPKGPPNPSRAGEDRVGIAEAIGVVREMVPGLPVVAGGQSYGGRQTSMIVAERPELADALVLTSYPLHAPGRADRMKTAHLPDITVPTVIVHGSKDTFATTPEIEDAAAMIPAPVTLVEIEGARHDLSPTKFAVVTPAVDAVLGALRARA
nr:alpha/beta fold hydrolase [Rhodococcus rhodnii]